MMKTKDGVDFKLGDTIFFEDGREIDTNPDDFVIDSFELEGEMVHCLCLAGGGGGIDLLKLYSSKRAIILDNMRHATEQLKYWTEELTRLFNVATQCKSS